MKKTILSGLLILMIAVLTMSGCGQKVNDSPPTTATVKIMGQGALASGTQIGGIDVTLLLPSGVTVKATADSVNPAVLVTNSGVVAASGTAAGANTLATGTYTAVTAATPGKVMVHVANPNGFGTGEFVTVNCDIAPGSSPKASDFSAAALSAKDLNGADITGMTAGLTVALQ